MNAYLLLEALHILSAMILFGTGLGTAFYLWMAHRSRDPHVIAVVGRHVVLGDWIFTGGAGVLQPVTGLGLVHLSGRDAFEPWLVMTYGLYALAFVCWAPVVWLQSEAARLAKESAAQGTSLPPRYFRLMRIWFYLGWPAFLALIGVLLLMVLKPSA
jgi:uncharacterized membrane protein